MQKATVHFLTRTYRKSAGVMPGTHASDRPYGKLTLSRAREMIHDPEVFERLHRHGYHIIHVGSGFSVTTSNARADTNVHFGRLFNEFQTTALEATLLKKVVRKHFIDNHLRSHILKTFGSIPFTTPDSVATFTMAHVVSPHPPYLFDSTGGPTGPATEKPYLQQLSYINKLTLETVKRIVDHSPDAIILIQADHGVDSRTVDWQQVAPEKRLGRFAIFSAARNGENGPAGVPESYTAVNTFRWVLSEALGDELPLLDNRFFVAPASDLCRIHEVTVEVFENTRFVSVERQQEAMPGQLK